MAKKRSRGFVSVLVLCMILWPLDTYAYIGINWGRESSQRLIPSMVVDLLLQNGIKNVRIFQQGTNVLDAFYNSGITVTFGFGNAAVNNYLDMNSVRKWIDEKIITYEQVIKFGYITVGNEPFGITYGNNPTMYFNVTQVMMNMQNKLNENKRSYIKATTAHAADVLTLSSSFKPSEADFRADIKDKMVEFVRLLGENEAPFMLSLYPLQFVNQNKVNLEFAFIDNKSNYSVTDINATYRNVFELLYDSMHWALTKAGVGHVKIVISSIGWPTDSCPGGTAENAQRFYKEFLPYITKGVGTPMRPNQNIDVFLHTLSDENKQPWGGYQRHWGIYKNNGEAKYMIDFSGQGRDVLPSTAKGVVHMPNRWCVFNGNMENTTKVAEMKTMACSVSDCSSLEPSGSCSNLTYGLQVSYAFNRYYQTMKQASQLSNEKCNLGGLGMVVPVDPSKGTCEFPVEICSAETAVQGLTFGAGKRVSASAGILVLINVLRMII